MLPAGPDGCAPEEPLIEVAGKLQFGLPGRPLFPALPQDTNLKPTLDWTLQADRGGPLDAELSYVTGGMTWEADYNVIAPTSGDTLDLIGWVTMENRTGKTFENAHIKLMAGDVNKIRPGSSMHRIWVVWPSGGIAGGVGGGPPVTEKPFDEYHLYTLERHATFRDRETKQVEFVRVPASTPSAYTYMTGAASIPLACSRATGSTCASSVTSVRPVPSRPRRYW